MIDTLESLTIKDKETAKVRLTDIGLKLKQKNLEYLAIKKEVDSFKEEAKSLLDTLEISEFGDENFNLKLTLIEKPQMNENAVIEYLKNNGLDKYIRVKEYIDPDELIIAAQRGELKVEDLQPFMSVKVEKRLNIK